MDLTTAVLSLLAGIGVFLIACTLLSNNLESICSTKLRNLFARSSDKKLVGVGIGAVSTAAIQSSGATTVLIIGFVNAGIVSLTLAAAMIYGANIGTTITAQIVAFGFMGGDTLKLSVIFAALAGVGAFVNAYAKTDKMKKIGGIIAGFGMLFVGLQLMEEAMGGLSEESSVKEFLGSIENIILLVLVGAALTALVQSSSVMTSIIIAMLMVTNPLINLEQAIYLTMGSNIGSCVVAIMAGFSSGGLNAKRTPLIHLLFNVIGVVIFVTVGFILNAVAGITYSGIFSGLFSTAATQLAMFHTVFNVITVIIMLPLTGGLIKLVMKILPDKKMGVIPEDEHGAGAHLYFLDEHMLTTPAIAVGEVKNEILKMAEFSMDNVKRASRIVCTLDMSEKEKFDEVENQIDYMNFAISHFLIKLSARQLSGKDVAYISTAFHSITDLERVGDYAENIVEYAEKLHNGNEMFSESAQKEIRSIVETIERLYNEIIVAYRDNSEEALRRAYDIEQNVDDTTDAMTDHHISRLADGTCRASVGAEFLSLTSDVERIADHFINVGRTIRDTN